MNHLQPNTCAIGALLKNLGYEYKAGQKFANNKKDMGCDPHPAILELASLLNIVGITDIIAKNDKGPKFRYTQRYNDQSCIYEERHFVIRTMAFFFNLLASNCYS
jgi:hypothetical protein